MLISLVFSPESRVLHTFLLNIDVRTVIQHLRMIIFIQLWRVCLQGTMAWHYHLWLVSHPLMEGRHLINLRRLPLWVREVGRVLRQSYASRVMLLLSQKGIPLVRVVRLWQPLTNLHNIVLWDVDSTQQLRLILHGRCGSLKTDWIMMLWIVLLQVLLEHWELHYGFSVWPIGRVYRKQCRNHGGQIIRECWWNLSILSFNNLFIKPSHVICLKGWV